MYFYSFLICFTPFVRSISWRKTILKIYSTNYYESCNTKRKLEILTSLQFFYIYAKAYNYTRINNIDKNDIKITNLDLEIIKFNQKFSECIYLTIHQSTELNISEKIEKYELEMQAIINNTNLSQRDISYELESMFYLPVCIFEAKLTVKFVCIACKFHISAWNIDKFEKYYLEDKLNSIILMGKKKYVTVSDLENYLELILD